MGKLLGLPMGVRRLLHQPRRRRPELGRQPAAAAGGGRLQLRHGRALRRRRDAQLPVDQLPRRPGDAAALRPAPGAGVRRLAGAARAADGGHRRSRTARARGRCSAAARAGPGDARRGVPDATSRRTGAADATTSGGCTRWAMPRSWPGGWAAFSNFAISLSIICILAGGVTSFHLGLCSVGGASIGLGWPLVAPVRAGGRGDDGPARLGVPDGRRPLPLGVDPRRPRLGLGDGLVQPRRPGHRAGRDQRRHLSLRRRGPRAAARDPVALERVPASRPSGSSSSPPRRRRSTTWASA